MSKKPDHILCLSRECTLFVRGFVPTNLVARKCSGCGAEVCVSPSSLAVGLPYRCEQCEPVAVTLAAMGVLSTTYPEGAERDYAEAQRQQDAFDRRN